MYKNDYNKLLDTLSAQLNIYYPDKEDLTKYLLFKINDFIETDFEGTSDNKIFHNFLITLQEMIEFSFENDATKSYLRMVFKTINNEPFLKEFNRLMPSKEKNINFLFNKLYNLFVYQDATSSHDYRLTEILDFLEYYK